MIGLNMAPGRFRSLDSIIDDPNLKVVVKDVAGFAEETIKREEKITEDSVKQYESVKALIRENRDMTEGKFDELKQDLKDGLQSINRMCSTRVDRCGDCFRSLKERTSTVESDIRVVKHDLESVKEIGGIRVGVISAVAGIIGAGMSFLILWGTSILKLQK